MHGVHSQHYLAVNTFLSAPNKFMRYKAVAKEQTPDYAFVVPAQKARPG